MSRLIIYLGHKLLYGSSGSCDELWWDTVLEYISLQQTGFTTPPNH